MLSDLVEGDATGYDLIGDVHGHCDELERLLVKLGYRIEGGSYRHESRKAIFVGDLIDRGPRVRDTLKLVKAMHDRGAALVVLGNHEYNAVCYCTADDSGDWLRPHSEKNQKQFQATLDAFVNNPGEWEAYLDWFLDLPLYLDLGAFRVVHACWSQRHIETVSRRTLRDLEFLLRSAEEGSPEYGAVEVLLKGPEVSLPEGSSYRDKDGHLRTKARVKWWLSLRGLSYREASFPEQCSLPDALVAEEGTESQWDVYPASAPPVFVGHYWLPPRDPKPYGNVVCLDYSVAKGGFLAAYRWNAEEGLDDGRFVVESTPDIAT